MRFSPKYRFSDWPNKAIPDIAAGIYVIWHGDRLFYCGMSGRGIEKALESGSAKKYGLVTRLNSHSSGRLSGDQFCVYVANRLVIPSLRFEDFEGFASGEMKLDHLTKAFIHKHLEYQYMLVDSSSEAYAVEKKARQGGFFDQQPLLNPLD